MALGRVILVVCIVAMFLTTDSLAQHRRRHQRASRRRPPLSEFPPRLHRKFASIANNFTWNMYKQLAKGRENLVFSPISVFKTISMAYLGTRNNTAREIFNVMGFGILKKRRKVRKAFRHLDQMMRRPMRDVTLKMADVLYVHEGIHLRNSFVKRLRKFYKAKVNRYNRKSKEDASSSISKWVRKNTHGKVRSFLPNLSMKKRKALWFVNTVFLNGSWDVVFDPSNTNKSTFSVNSHRQSKVDMMFNDWRYYYKVNTDLKVKVIEMPYSSHRLSFFIILPDEVDGLQRLEEKLTSETFQDLVTNMDGPARFYIRMPRINLSTHLDLKAPLQSLGIKSIFGNDANLSPVDGTTQLFIDHMIHMSVLDVNEGGTEGAGVTGAGIMLRSVPPEFKADRPFMFVIKDKVTRTDVFMGKFSNPSGL